MQRSRRAFTLIELLVVIAIIAILAAILFPVFAQARDKARQTACLSHAKQIGTAIAMYTQDYDEMYPNIDFGMYLIQVQPYAKNEQLWQCPSEVGNYRIDRRVGLLNPPADKWVKTSWAANGSVLGGWNATASKSSTIVQEPTTTVLMAEGYVNRSAAPNTTNAEMGFDACQDIRHVWFHRQYGVTPPGVWPTGSPGGGRLAPRHAQGMNVVWADYHAKHSKTPPEDCHTWVPAYPAGTKKISTSYSGACRPDGQPATWCYSN